MSGLNRPKRCNRQVKRSFFVLWKHTQAYAVATRSSEAAGRRTDGSWCPFGSTSTTWDAFDAAAGTARSYTLLRWTPHASLSSERGTTCPGGQCISRHATTELRAATSGFIGWLGTKSACVFATAERSTSASTAATAASDALRHAAASANDASEPRCHWYGSDATNLPAELPAAHGIPG